MRARRSVTLTRLQAIVLAIVESHGPVSPADVAYHWPSITEASARGLLARLEAKRFVEATYTGFGSTGRARAYYATERGTAALGEAGRPAGEPDDPAA